jgi:hypothetical protein
VVQTLQRRSQRPFWCFMKQFTLCLTSDHSLRARFSVNTSGLEKTCVCEFFMTVWDWKNSIFTNIIVEPEERKNVIFTMSSGGTWGSGTKGVWISYHRRRVVVLSVLSTRFIVARVSTFSSWKNQPKNWHGKVSDFRPLVRGRNP